MCSHVQSHVSPCVWCTLPHALIFYKQLFTVRCTKAPCRVQQQGIAISSGTSESKWKSSRDVAGTTVLLKVLYCKIENVFFIFFVCLCFMYYLCEKYYKPYSTVLGSRLCQLGTQANFVGLMNTLSEVIHMQGTYCVCKLYLLTRLKV